MRIFSASASIGMSLSLLCSSALIVPSDCENWDPKYDEALAERASKKEKQELWMRPWTELIRYLKENGKPYKAVEKALRELIKAKKLADREERQKNKAEAFRASPCAGIMPAQPTTAVARQALLPHPMLYTPYHQAFFIQAPRQRVDSCLQRDVWRTSSGDLYNKHQKFINQQSPYTQESLLQGCGALCDAARQEWLREAYWENFRYQQRTQREYERMQQQRNF
ncbi:hypothetical protein JST99_04930 [Candidatus Dependentiae bacterium]|nr:hypothetical protein [Candidatus Dependentiae bacterium]MCC7415261.1 hypothetical protein [Campylobacterota bacterium]